MTNIYSSYQVHRIHKHTTAAIYITITEIRQQLLLESKSFIILFLTAPIFSVLSSNLSSKSCNFINLYIKHNLLLIELIWNCFSACFNIANDINKSVKGLFVLILLLFLEFCQLFYRHAFRIIFLFNLH